MPISIQLPVMVMFAFVLIHMIVMRIFGAKFYMRVSFMIMLLFLFAMTGFILFLGQSGLLISIFVFLSLWSFYTIFMVNIIRSVSLRLMYEMSVSPNNHISITELKKRYSYDEMLMHRVEAMVENGLLVDDGVYNLSNKGKLLLWVFISFRKLFNVKKYG